MKAIIADTNVFLRFLLSDILKQKQAAERLFRQAKSKKITLLIPQIIIFEINFILERYYLFTKGEVVGKLESLVSTNYFEVESKEIFAEALKLYKDQSISLVDCFLISKAKLEEAELFTFDEKLRKLV